MWIGCLLKPFIPNCVSVQDSLSRNIKFTGLCLNESRCVSFDTVLPFTNLQIEDTIQRFLKTFTFLSAIPLNEPQNSLAAPIFLSCLMTKITQIRGLGIEYSLSHLLAEVTMDMVENTLEMLQLHLILVGEVFAIFDYSDSADDFFDKGNSISPDLKSPSKDLSHPQLISSTWISLWKIINLKLIGPSWQRTLVCTLPKIPYSSDAYQRNTLFDRSQNSHPRKKTAQKIETLWKMLTILLTLKMHQSWRNLMWRT